MTALARALRDFWCKPVRAEPLALFRILTGLCLLGACLTGFAPHLGACCGPDGLYPAPALDDWLKRSGRFCLLRGPVSLPLLNRLPESWASAWAEWSATPSATYLLFLLFLVSLVLVTVGLWARVSTFVALVLAITFHNRFTDLMNGGDDLLRTALYFLLLSPAGAAWSLDAWRRRRRATQLGQVLGPPLIAPWSVRLMQIQLCAIYLFTGLVKAYLPGDEPNAWLTGEAIYWVLNDVALCRWPYAWLPIPLFVCRLLSWATLAFELGFSALVLVRPVRPWLLLAGVGLHVGILLTMEIGWFSQAILCWYVLFLSGEGLGTFFARLGLARPARLP
jgi:hypothetical protein